MLYFSVGVMIGLGVLYIFRDIRKAGQKTCQKQLNHFLNITDPCPNIKNYPNSNSSNCVAETIAFFISSVPGFRNTGAEFGTACRLILTI